MCVHFLTAVKPQLQFLHLGVVLSAAKKFLSDHSQARPDAGTIEPVTGFSDGHMSMV